MKTRNIMALNLALSCLVACNSQAADYAFSGPFAQQKQALANKVKTELVKLEGGSFEMGDWGVNGGYYDMDSDSNPLHKVTLNTFYMQPYKVTYEEFDLFTDDTSKDRINIDHFGMLHRTPKSPAGVGWQGAQDYCSWLGQMTNLPLTLPTEAQWEYAARSGGQRVLFATNDGNNLPKRGENYPHKKNMRKPPLPAVGSYPPNPAGLYDMTGDSVFEWVADWYSSSYYDESPEHEPKGPKHGTQKVQRGGEFAFGMTDGSQIGVVFTRLASPPVKQTAAGIKNGEFLTKPYEGYSGSYLDTFRCVVNVSELP